MRTVGNLTVHEAPDSPKWTFAEVDKCERTFTGPYADLFSKRPTRGAPMEGSGADMLVQDSTLKRSKGSQGVLTVNLVGGNPSWKGGPDAPLKVTVEIDWVAVSKDLRSHPMYHYPEDADTEPEGVYSNDPAAWMRIEKWKNETNLELRKQFKFGTGAIDEILAPNEQHYAKKILRGVESYNVYAPIVRKTTLLSKKPSGSKAGFVQDPAVDAEYPDGYKWLKTACRSTQQQDKTWQLAEEWTGADEVDADLYPAAPTGALSAAKPKRRKKP